MPYLCPPSNIIAMRSLFFVLGFSAWAHCVHAQAPTPVSTDNYQFFVDLTQVKGDRLDVSLIVPKLASDEAIYCLPKIVPGTYSIYDFGRFVNNFKVINQKGEILPSEKIDDNRWKISRAQSAYRITYAVWKDSAVFGI